MTERIFKPIYRSDEDGELGRLPNNGIINAGGVSGPTFTVGGRGLLFDDGTSSGVVVGAGITLDGVYTNSTVPATINLVSGKDLVFNAVNSKRFIFDALTGTVTIEGSLNVLGASNVVEGTISNLDQVNIRTPQASTVGLTLQPMIGITPTANLLDVAVLSGGPSVFSISPTGTTALAQVEISGLFNGVSADEIATHIDQSTTPSKHSAPQISVDDSTFARIVGDDVQSALESIDSQLGGGGSGITGFEYIQSTSSTIWTILHSAGTNRVHITLWDDNNFVVLPDEISIIDNNTVRVSFAGPQAGRAVLMLF